MSQPSPYNRAYNFTNRQSTNPSDPLPGNQVDAEYNRIKQTLDQILNNLALIQRDDTRLANGSVGRDQLSADLYLGFGAPAPWETDRNYASSDTVFKDQRFYLCEESHVSGVFADDYNAGYWTEIADFTGASVPDATSVPFSPVGNISVSNVQAAIEQLDSIKLTADQNLADLDDAAIAFGNIKQAASETAAGVVELATVAEVATGTDTARAVTPAGIAALVASDTAKGIVELATDAEVQAGLSTSLAVTPASVAARTATTTRTGLAELATQAEAEAGADTSRITTPQGVRQAVTYGSGIGGAFAGLMVQVTSNTAWTVTADWLAVADTSGNVRILRGVSVTGGMGSTGANGRDAGSETSQTWYYVFVIWNPTTNTTATLVSTSSTSPTMPSGYTYKMRVGAIRNDGSSNLWRTIQKGRRAHISVGTNPTAPPQVSVGATGTYDNVSPTYTAVAVIVASGSAAFAPDTACAIGVILANKRLNGTVRQVLVAPNNSYAGPTTNSPPPLYAPDNTQISFTGWVGLESSSIYVVSSGSDGGVFAFGWEDNL